MLLPELLQIDFVPIIYLVLAALVPVKTAKSVEWWVAMGASFRTQ
jgi:hypothetical protein